MSVRGSKPEGKSGVFVLDVDPGIDDAVALFLTQHLVHELCVVVTSFGNAPLDVTHRNLRRPENGTRLLLSCGQGKLRPCFPEASRSTTITTEPTRWAACPGCCRKPTTRPCR